MTKEQQIEQSLISKLISLLPSNANLMDERDDIVAYLNTLQAGKSLNEKETRQGYDAFKSKQSSAHLAQIAVKTGWKARTQAELALMDDLVTLLKKLAQGREISGLAAYE